jgi:2-(1,2-epoxy-1,2-dihydrophenyl)acetyl-CoA isomerase
MSYSNILFELDGGIARLTLNRPEKLNSFTAAMHEEIRDVLGCVRAAAGLRVMLITGAGRGFCAGQDLGDCVVAPDAEPPDLGGAIERHYAPLVLALRSLPMPVVCAVNGVAAGAGVNFALACDIVVAKKSASFIQSFARLGLIPDTGGTYFLPRLVGTARAMGLAMLGEKLTAEEAAEWGLIWKCFDDEAFEVETEKLVALLANGATLGLTRMKEAIYGGSNRSLEEQLMVERDAMRELGWSEDFAESVKAFLEKRAAEFHGR